MFLSGSCVCDSVCPCIALFLYSILKRFTKLTALMHSRRRRRAQWAFAPPPKKKSRENDYFSSKYHVIFGHFVNFSYKYFGAKMSCSKVGIKSSYAYVSASDFGAKGSKFRPEWNKIMMETILLSNTHYNHAWTWDVAGILHGLIS